MDRKLDCSVPPRRVRALIGDVVMVGADLDMLISLAICDLKSLDPRSELGKFARMQFRQRLELLQSEVNAREQDVRRDDLETFSQNIRPLLDLRNTVAHGRYEGRHMRSDGLMVYVFQNPHEPVLEKTYVDKLRAGPDRVGKLVQCTTEPMLLGAIRDGRQNAAAFKAKFGVRYLHERYRALMKVEPLLAEV